MESKKYKEMKIEKVGLKNLAVDVDVNAEE